MKENHINEQAGFSDYKAQIKALRVAAGMTQEQLGKMVNRTGRAIRHIENGEAFPRISTLQNIAAALDAELTISLTRETGISAPNTGETGGEETRREENEFPPGWDNDIRVG
ncbi:MAG: helix-turn-helix transcriptional regulator, partial [bacterium]|nr:helix-turn-helix transcriptional regulator [bacterium]